MAPPPFRAPARSPFGPPPASFDVRLDGKSLSPRDSQPVYGYGLCAESASRARRIRRAGRTPPTESRGSGSGSRCVARQHHALSSPARNQIARQNPTARIADLGNGMPCATRAVRCLTCCGSDPRGSMGIVNWRRVDGTSSEQDSASPCRCRQVARLGEPHQCGMWLASSMRVLAPSCRPGLGPKICNDDNNNKLQRKARTDSPLCDACF